MTGLPNFQDRHVPSQFPILTPCRLALIGEAPGDEEVQHLRPFIGPSGRLLNSMLRSAGIERADCYVGNVYDTKLDENDITAHKRRIGEAAFAALHHQNITRLASELDAASPDVLVPLGGTALLAVAGTSRIMAHRGHAGQGTGLFGRYKIVPTLHPAMVLKAWKMFVPVVHDLVRAASEAERGPSVRYPKRLLYLDPTIGEVEAYLEFCATSPRLSVDIETGWGMIRGISFAPYEDEAMYVPFINLSRPDKNHWPTFEYEKRAWLAVKRLLESSTPKLGQNFGGYDAHWLLEKQGIRVYNFRDDLRLLHKSLYPELPASLEFMAGAYSSQGAWKHFVSHSGSTKANRGDKRDE